MDNQLTQDSVTKIWHVKIVVSDRSDKVVRTIRTTASKNRSQEEIMKWAQRKFAPIGGDVDITFGGCRN